MNIEIIIEYMLNMIKLGKWIISYQLLLSQKNKICNDWMFKLKDLKLIYLIGYM